MSADKCPHCGAERSERMPSAFMCGTHRTFDGPFYPGALGCEFRSNMCVENATYTKMQKSFNAMRESRDEVNERLAALNEWVDFHKEELAATRQELESAKGLHQQCLDSVTMIIVTFPNAAEYVRQMEKQRDSALARVAELEAAIELARVGH